MVEEAGCSQAAWEQLLCSGAFTSLASRILEQEKSQAAQLPEQMRDKSMCCPYQRPGRVSPATILHWVVMHTSGFQDSHPCSMTLPTMLLSLSCTICCSATNTVSVRCPLHRTLFPIFVPLSLTKSIFPCENKPCSFPFSRCLSHLFFG